MFLLLSACDPRLVDLPGTDTHAVDTADTDTVDTSDTDDTDTEDTDTTDTDTDDTDTADTDTTDTDTTDTDTGPVDTGPDRCVGEAAWLETAGTTHATLQEAITAAAADETIWVCPGTWLENLSIPAMPLTLQGYGADVSMIDGNGAGAVLIGDAGAVLQVLDLTLQHGVSPASGGALYGSYGSYTFTRVTFRGNHTEGDGGAVYSSNGTLSFEDCTFTGNTCVSNGGGIYAGYNVELFVSGSTFEDNVADYAGGAINAYSASPVTVTDSTFTDNVAGYQGGGLDWSSGGLTATLTVERAAFTANSSSYEGGGMVVGAYHETWPADVTITDTTFDANTTGSDGGGLATYIRAGAVTVTRATFTDNHSDSRGGAMALSGGPFTWQMLLEDSTLDGNTASYAGGALSLESSQVELTVSGGSVTSNVASLEGALDLDADAIVTVTGSDWGSGATDNSPDDWGGMSWGAAASFTCAADVCL